jgi:hypothetical protein
MYISSKFLSDAEGSGQGLYFQNHCFRQKEKLQEVVTLSDSNPEAQSCPGDPYSTIVFRES